MERVSCLSCVLQVGSSTHTRCRSRRDTRLRGVAPTQVVGQQPQELEVVSASSLVAHRIQELTLALHDVLDR